MWTAASGPCHGGPSNKHWRSKKWNTRGKDFFFVHMQNIEKKYWVETMICRICNNDYEYAEYGKNNNMQINMHNLHNMQTAHQYAKYGKKNAEK
jgi:hypothetical protein